LPVSPLIAGASAVVLQILLTLVEVWKYAREELD